MFVVLFCDFFFCHSSKIIAHKNFFVKYFAGYFCEIFYKKIEIISIVIEGEKLYNLIENKYLEEFLNENARFR